MKLQDKNNPQLEYMFFEATMGLLSPSVRESLIEDAEFCRKYNVRTKATITLGMLSAQFDRDTFVEVAKTALSGSNDVLLISKDGLEFLLNEDTSEPGVINFTPRESDEASVSSDFFPLSPDKNVRLAGLKKTLEAAYMPPHDAERWKVILSERTLNNEEIDNYYKDILNTPEKMGEQIRNDVLNGKAGVSALVPKSKKYYERLIGEYNDAPTIQKYTDDVLKNHFKELISWGASKGLSNALVTAAHPYISDAIDISELEITEVIQLFANIEKNGDPVSIIAAAEIGLKALKEHSEFEPQIFKLIEKIRDDDLGEKSNGIKLFTSIVMLVDGELSRIKLFAKQPPFYRRLASLTHAALIYRQFIHLRINVEEFEKFVYFEEGMNFFTQTYADMRQEPRWSPYMLEPSQFKADILGRILIAAGENNQHIVEKPIYKLIFGDESDAIQQRSDLLRSFRPGPLEGAASANPNVPIEFVEEIEKKLDSDEDKPQRFSLLLNSALIFKLDPRYATRTAEILKDKQYHLNHIESRDQLANILSGLATLAAATRSGALADEVLVLLRAYRQDDEFKLTVEECIQFGLEAAASKAEMREWADFVGKLFRNIAFSDLEYDEARSAFAYLHCLCRCVPLLWKSCAQAEAGLQAFLELSAS